ncbi:esterase/lipase family protein [Pseudonocardia phyllosphaerae]|uniref:esterase/lipase family protein n=1 Tax=Pseudonocardia phyllosphaerae TaxID=3390502 RepID=UPI00397E4659
MGRRWATTGAMALVTAVASLALTTPAAAAEPPAVPAPVPAPAAPAPLPGDDPFNPSPPGANDWNCRPGAEHPNPVVLAHGLTANRGDNWGYIAPALEQRGYCVFALTYGQNPAVPAAFRGIGGLTAMEDSAREFGGFVDRVLAATGAKKVDIVGHSEGSLMPNYYIKFLGGAKHVDRYVGMTPLWDGTRLYGVDQLNRTARGLGLDPALAATLDPYCTSCRQFLRGSDFLKKMSSGGGPAVPGVTYTMIITRFDEVVIPYTSGLLDGARNIVLQRGCPTDVAEHIAVSYDPVTLQHIQNALDPAHAAPVRCVPFGPLSPLARR